MRTASLALYTLSVLVADHSESAITTMLGVIGVTCFAIVLIVHDWRSS